MNILGYWKTCCKCPIGCLQVSPWCGFWPASCSSVALLVQVTSGCTHAAPFAWPALTHFSSVEVLLFKVIQGLSILFRVTLPPSSKKDILREHSRLTQFSGVWYLMWDLPKDVISAIASRMRLVKPKSIHFWFLPSDMRYWQDLLYSSEIMVPKNLIKTFKKQSINFLPRYNG